MQVQINPNLALHQLVAKEESVYLSRGLIYASLLTTKAPGVLAHLKMHRNTKSKYIYTHQKENFATHPEHPLGQKNATNPRIQHSVTAENKPSNALTH